MKELYWIVDETLIFKPEFNEELDNYYNVISQYNKIIFSNYNDPEITIKTENKYNCEHNDKYKKSIFNKKLKLTKNITHLSFGDCFNHSEK